jgi:hypothetical protein
MRNLRFVVLAVLMSACARVEATTPRVQVQMSNVDLHVTSDITLHVRRLQGAFVSVARRVPYLDDKRSYSVAVDSGEVAVDLASLNALVNRALGDDRSNVDKLRLAIAEDGTLRQKGVIDKAINIPFDMKSTLSVTPDGRIAVRTKSVKGFGVPIKPVMSLFHIGMDDLVKVKPGHGVVVAGNDLILDPSEMLPAPAIRGRLTSVRVEGNSLVQVFGRPRGSAGDARRSPRNRIYWRGGQLAFGKLTMSDTDLEIVDLDPDDPLDFSVDHWTEQLIAGYSKTLSNRGLRAFVPDYSDLKRTRASEELSSGESRSPGRRAPRAGPGSGQTTRRPRETKR